MDRLQRLFQGAGAAGAGGGPPADTPQVDTAEQIYISSLALLKMLKHGCTGLATKEKPFTQVLAAQMHTCSNSGYFPIPCRPARAGHVFMTNAHVGRAGVPMEVMGLMLGEFVDDYTVKVVDVFAMPQSGTGVSVEAVDPVFQTKMLEMLKQVGRPEMVVGWYHSHPGFGCWLSGVDINTQQSFEALNARAVAVVVDPIQSVKGKVVIDAFRLINPQTMMLGQEARQTTSNIGHLNKPSIQALIHGLNRHYYSIAISYRKNELEERMLMNLQKKNWSQGLELRNFEDHTKDNSTVASELQSLSDAYDKSLVEEQTISMEKRLVANVGKLDAKQHLEREIQHLMSSNIVQCMRAMLDTICI